MNWCLGHLATSEDWFLKLLTGAETALSEDTHAKYKAGQSPTSNAGDYPGKADVWGMFQAQRKRVLAALEKDDPGTWDDPAPEGLPPLFKTRGSIWGLIATHQYWHLGQIMSIRRMVGKPPALG